MRFRALLLVACAGCVSRGGLEGTPGASATGGASTGGDDASATTLMPSDGAEPSTGEADESDGGDGTDRGDDASFLPAVDLGAGSECDTFTQDCPPDMKCMPWANDGGSAWNATRCSPIAADPKQRDEPCTVEGSAVSGIDDCDVGLMCWNVDERGEGTCRAMCTGASDNPICETPGEWCPISADGVLTLCFPTCNPLTRDCPHEGEGCYPYADHWGCAPDASGELGGFGEPCEFINRCDAGLACLGADAFSDCVGSLGCCGQLCDVADANADAACAALDPAQTCVPWYADPGTTPPGFANVGVCAIAGSG